MENSPQAENINVPCQPPSCSPPNGCAYCTQNSNGTPHCGCAPCGNKEWVNELDSMDFNPGLPEELILTVNFHNVPLWAASHILNRYSTEEFLVPASRMNDTVELPAEEMPLAEIAERMGLVRMQTA